MKKAFLFILLLTSIALQVHGQTNLQWHFNSTGSSNGYVGQMLEFPNGDVLVKGYNTGGDMDPGIGTSVLNTTVFFARYTPAGNMVFCRPLSYNASFPSYGTWMDMDADGNFCYIVRGNGTFDFDPVPGVGEIAIANECMIVKFDSMGIFQWGVVYSIDFTIYNLITLSDKSIVICGTHDYGTGDLDPGPGSLMINTICAEDGFAAKFDSSGNFISGKQFMNTGGGFNSTLTVGKVASDAFDNIYLTGTLVGTFDMNPGVGTFNLTGNTAPPSSYESFVVQLDSNMDFAFAYKFPNDIRSLDVTGVNSNGFILLGSFDNPVDIDPSAGVTMIDTDPNFTSYFVAKFNVTGNLQWVKTLKTTYYQGAVSIFPIQVDNNGFFNFDFYLGAPIVTNSFGFPQLPNNGFSTPGNYMVQLNASGNVIYCLRYPEYPGFQNPLSLKVDANNFFVSGRIWDAIDIQMGPGITLSTPASGNEFMLSYYSMDPSLNRIEGNAFLDLNNNNIRDPNENGIQNLITNINPGNYFISTDNLGNFGAYVPTGSYGISIPTVPAYLSGPVPLMHAANFPLANQVDTANSFAFDLNVSEMDVAVNLTRLNPARPGMNTGFNLTFSNEGVVSQSGVISLLLDSNTTFLSSTLTPASVTGQLIEWNFNSLNPLQASNINFTVLIDSSLQIGDTIITSVEITSQVGDNNISNNTDSNITVITGSWDPNSKEVNPQGDITDEQVVAGIELTYTLNFQNTGNDTAFFVTLLDTLSNDLDISSLKIISSSHPYYFTLYQNNLMEFRFNNILLPDSNVNELASHGFVKYKIKPNSNLIPGDFIENLAYIYFDYNASVVTNTTHTNIVDFVGIQEQQGLLGSIVYPNPFNNEIVIRTSISQGEKREVSILDIMGKVVSRFESYSEEIKINTSEISKGIYILNIKNEEDSENIKVIKL